MFFVENKQIGLSDDTVDKRIANAISSIFENRLPIFLPIKKLHQSRIQKIFEKNNNAVFFETDFGKIEARARLVTQAHKTYLEAILSYKKQLLTDGSFYVEFMIYDLLSKKLKKTNPTDYETFKKYLKELKDFNVVIHTKNSNREIGFSFIDDFVIDNETGAYKVKFTRLFSTIWLNETLISYKSNSKINEIDNVIVQSVIRYMMTYDNLQISVKNLAKKLSYDTIFEKRTFYEKIEEIKNSFSIEEIKKIYDFYGITYDSNFGNIIINRTDEVFLDHFKSETLSKKLLNDKNSAPQHNKSAPQHNS